jgi:CheY-like chemotaxis protein
MLELRQIFGEAMRLRGSMILGVDKKENIESGTIDSISNQEIRILIIDDDDDFRKSFCFKLRRKFKAQVDDVDSGKSGIEKLRNGNAYNLIFTDIMMPEMTGIEAYQELRKIDANIRIVIMSAYSNSEEWRKAQELKDVALIHKPIPEDVLIKILSESAEE